MQCCGKHRQHCDSVALQLLMPREKSTPAAQGRATKTHVLPGMRQITRQRRLKQAWYMPDPERYRMQGPDYKGVRQHSPATPHTLTPFPKLMPPWQGQCPEEEREWSAKHEERRGNEHKHCMLDHVRGEENSPERMQRGDQRHNKRAPATPKGHNVP